MLVFKSRPDCFRGSHNALQGVQVLRVNRLAFRCMKKGVRRTLKSSKIKPPSGRPLKQSMFQRCGKSADCEQGKHRSWKTVPLPPRTFVATRDDSKMPQQVFRKHRCFGSGKPLELVCSKCEIWLKIVLTTPTLQISKKKAPKI